MGAYEEIGITELIFYWPPIAYFRDQEPIPADVQARFERIAGDRIARR